AVEARGLEAIELRDGNFLRCDGKCSADLSAVTALISRYRPRMGGFFSTFLPEGRSHRYLHGSYDHRQSMPLSADVPAVLAKRAGGDDLPINTLKPIALLPAAQNPFCRGVDSSVGIGTIQAQDFFH